MDGCRIHDVVQLLPNEADLLYGHSRHRPQFTWIDIILSAELESL